jgi:hypothetical protein
VSLAPAINPCHGEITKILKFFAGVNDTAEKLFTGANDTADELFNSLAFGLCGEWSGLRQNS